MAPVPSRRPALSEGLGIQQSDLCACGRDAIDVLRVASEDGVLLIPVCAECADDPVVAEQREMFEPTQRRPLSAMPARDDARQLSLPLDDVSGGDEQRSAA
jgi:hypothetical protein